MKKLLIVANWKSNMSIRESDSWIEHSAKSISLSENKTVIICPPFTLLSLLHSSLRNQSLKYKLGAQDVSAFPKGAYTGAVAAEQLKEFVSYVIIGHSERRKYFHEDDQMLQNKVDLVRTSGLTPIYCVQDAQTIIPKGVRIVAYEPTFAIGTGEPDSPENAEKVAESISASSKDTLVLYGGSVTEKNVHSFTAMEHISGVLVGSASLDPIRFAQIIENA